MQWYYLIAAITLEVCGTVCMKLSDGLEKPVPSVLVYVFYIASFYFLAAAIKQVDLGIAYAIWAGSGTALVAIIGVAYFKEPMTVAKVICTLLIIVGVVGLKLDSPSHETSSIESSAESSTQYRPNDN